MDSPNLKSILQDAVEGKIPPTQIELWPAVKRRLVASERISPKGELNMQPTIARKPVLGLAVLAALVLLFLLLATPIGQALAQSLLRFFTRAQSDAVPVTPITETTTYVFNLTVVEAEGQAGFDVLEPTWLPVDGSGVGILSLKGATLEPEHNIVRIFYRYNQGGDDLTDGLLLREERFQTAHDCELCGMVGASAAVESIQIGGVTGEYVEGVWKADNSGVWKWESDSYIKTLRWQINDIACEIQYFGLELEQADLIAIAGSIR
jgi:hypothetical protein